MNNEDDVKALRAKANGLLECAKEASESDDPDDSGQCDMLISDAAQLLVLAELVAQNEITMAAIAYSGMDTDCAEWVIDLCPQLHRRLKDISKTNNYFRKDTSQQP